MTQYKHKEAFCLMQYYCKPCGHFEIIWNSRDGVTPFMMQCPSCGGTDMHHVNFHRDRCVPDYKPFLGQRMWVDMTRERAEEIVKGRNIPAKHLQAVIDDIYRDGLAPDLAIHGYDRKKDV